MVWAQSQVKWAMVAWKSSTYDITQNIWNPQSKKFFSSADYKTCHVFWHFDQVRNPYRSRDIPAYAGSMQVWRNW